MKAINNKILKQRILKAYKDLGRVPTRREVKKSAAIEKRFGSWNKSLKQVGLPVIRKNKYEDNEIIIEFKKEMKRLGDVGLASHYEKRRSKLAPSLSTLHRKFGTWEEILNLINRKPIKEKSKFVKTYSDEEIRTTVVNRYNAVGEVSRREFFSECDLNYRLAYRRLGVKNLEGMYTKIKEMLLQTS